MARKLLVAVAVIAVALLPGSARGERTQAGPGFIVFVTDRGGSSDIYSANTRGSAQTPLVATDAEEADPAVAPAGAALAWASNADGTWQIYVARSGDTEGTRLTTGPYSNVDPVWSPSGKQIAFETNRTGDWEIFVMNADGSEARAVSNRSADDFDPTWRDERTVVFTGVETPAGSDLYRTDVLAQRPRPVRITNTPADESDPSYSPDRRRIALTQLYGRDYEIAVSSAARIRPARLTRFSGPDVAPSWARGGTHLLFTRSRRSDLEIFEVRAVPGSTAVNLSRRPLSNEWEAEFARVLPQLSIRRLASRAVVTVSAPSFTCENPGPFVSASPAGWTVVNGTNTLPPAPGDKLCGNTGRNRVLARSGVDKLAGFDEVDHLEGGNHNDLFLTQDGYRDCLYGGYTHTVTPSYVSSLCVKGALAAATRHTSPSTATNDLAWPDKGQDKMLGIDKVEP